MSSNSQINVNSFRDKIRIKCTLYFHSYSKSHYFWRNLLRWQKIYTAAGSDGSDGSDKSHLCLGVNYKKVQFSPPTISSWLFKVNTWKLGSALVWRGRCWSLSPSSQIVIVKSVDRPSLSSSLPMPCRSYKHGLHPMTGHISYLFSTWGYFSPNSVQTYGFPEIGRMCRGGRHGQDEEKEIEFHLLQYKRVCKGKNIWIVKIVLCDIVIVKANNVNEKGATISCSFCEGGRELALKLVYFWLKVQ